LFPFVGEGFKVTLNFTVERVLRVFKNEAVSYFDTFFSRKGAAPICLVLCLVIVLVYITSKTGSLIWTSRIWRYAKFL